MRQPTRSEITASFVNSSRSRVKSVSFPDDFDRTPWEDLDFYGWIDPRAPQRAYLVCESEDGFVGVEFRVAGSDPSRARGVMCNLCRSARRNADTNLFTAAKAGPAGKAGNSVGTYICTDFHCSLYVRNLMSLPDPQPERSLPTETRIENLRHRLDGFVARVLGTDEVTNPKS
ncbi:FBP domain-containing protein [Rhodococcus sp. NPDC003382]|uniref:FBP domain-containing protein n=1 Tax=Rhodococcus sp. CX TaxID=2789880 RepID=UPI0018CF7610|nr:FBP domain-containing protein [Rhodococcus sp. CX]MBH0119058.1 FBP domain-containing protein [Rhodococcus sp. CX]